LTNKEKIDAALTRIKELLILIQAWRKNENN